MIDPVHEEKKGKGRRRKEEEEKTHGQSIDIINKSMLRSSYGPKDRWDTGLAVSVLQDLDWASNPLVRHARDMVK